MWNKTHIQHKKKNFESKFTFKISIYQHKNAEINTIAVFGLAWSGVLKFYLRLLIQEDYNMHATLKARQEIYISCIEINDLLMDY